MSGPRKSEKESAPEQVGLKGLSKSSKEKAAFGGPLKSGKSSSPEEMSGIRQATDPKGGSSKAPMPLD